MVGREAAEVPDALAARYWTGEGVARTAVAKPARTAKDFILKSCEEVS